MSIKKINKVIVNGKIKIDLTTTTATEKDVAKGKIFYNSKGEETVGVYENNIYVDSNFFTQKCTYGDICTTPDIYITLPENINVSIPWLFNDCSYCTYHVYLPKSTNFDCGDNVGYSPFPYNGGYCSFIWTLENRSIAEFYSQFDLDHSADDGGYPQRAAEFFDENGDHITYLSLPLNSSNELPPYLFYLDYYNYTLEEIEIPSETTYLGYNVLGTRVIRSYCTTPPYLSDSSIFNFDSADFKIIVPDGSKDLYINDDNWCNYAEYIIEESEEESL